MKVSCLKIHIKLDIIFFKKITTVNKVEDKNIILLEIMIFFLLKELLYLYWP